MKKIICLVGLLALTTSCGHFGHCKQGEGKQCDMHKNADCKCQKGEMSKQCPMDKTAPAAPAAPAKK